MNISQRVFIEIPHVRKDDLKFHTMVELTQLRNMEGRSGWKVPREKEQHLFSNFTFLNDLLGAEPDPHPLYSREISRQQKWFDFHQDYCIKLSDKLSIDRCPSL